MRHPHYNMIVAKAANMDLVVIANQEDKWNELKGWPAWNEHCEYFLCHPKHKEACLHWLNGGEVLVDCNDEDGERDFYGIFEYNKGATSDGNNFMRSDYNFRIKPRKEKLYIAVKTDKHEHLGGCRKVRICSHAFVSKEDAESYLDLSDSQLVEIEVEV